jgi:hypothetical protein
MVAGVNEKVNVSCFTSFLQLFYVGLTPPCAACARLKNNEWYDPLQTQRPPEKAVWLHPLSASVDTIPLRHKTNTLPSLVMSHGREMKARSSGLIGSWEGLFPSRENIYERR